MSDFERRREKNKEARELVKIRRENIAKYFFDLSKLTFAALVLGLGGAFFNIGNWERLSYVDTIPLIIWYHFGKLAAKNKIAELSYEEVESPTEGKIVLVPDFEEF